MSVNIEELLLIEDSVEDDADPRDIKEAEDNYLMSRKDICYQIDLGELYSAKELKVALRSENLSCKTIKEGGEVSFLSRMTDRSIILGDNYLRAGDYLAPAKDANLFSKIKGVNSRIRFFK